MDRLMARMNMTFHDVRYDGTWRREPATCKHDMEVEDGICGGAGVCR